MILSPAWALSASTSALAWRMTSSIGNSICNRAAWRLNLVLASAIGLMFCLFMRLLVLVCSLFHRRACLLDGQTTNRFFNYSRDIPLFYWMQSCCAEAEKPTRECLACVLQRRATGLLTDNIAD